MRISEIQRTQTTGSDDWESNERYKSVPDIQMVPSNDRYGYVDHQYNDSEKLNLTGSDRAIYFYDTATKSNETLYIGYIRFRNYRLPGIKNAMQVTNVLLDQRYRGQNLGIMMYTTALRIGYVIVADTTQTPQARKLWVKLNRTPGVDVRGIVKLSKLYIDSANIDKWNLKQIEKNRALLNSLGAKPLMPLEKFGKYDYIPFEFEVRPGQEDSELIANNLNLYSNKKPEDEDQFVTIYAKWVG